MEWNYLFDTFTTADSQFAHCYTVNISFLFTFCDYLFPIMNCYCLLVRDCVYFDLVTTNYLPDLLTT